MSQPRDRRVRASSIDLRRGRREMARSRGPYTIELGRERVDLSYLEQLAEAGQTEAIACIIGEFAAGNASREVEEVVNGALGSLRAGLDSLETSGGILGVEFAASTGGGCGDQPHPLARSRCGSLEDLDQQNHEVE